MSRLDLNRSPYFDDFDSSRNYMRVLFKPGFPVQARELNQIQSIAQNQTEKFANHVFKNGAKVSNARTSITVKDYVRLNDGAPNVSRFNDSHTIVGKVSGVEAILVRGVDATSTDPATIYVVYTKTAIDGVKTTFILGEELEVRDANGVNILEAGETMKVRCPGCPGSSVGDEGIDALGYGRFFTMDEGIFYFEGMFIETARQDLIIDKYFRDKTHGIIQNEPCKIGLDFVQTIVDFNDDQSLLDPSLGYPNSTAPGADRYKADLVLVKRPYDNDDGENFIALCRIGEGGRTEFMKSDSEYADLGDELARRTYETSGNYTIRPFKVQFYNEKQKDENDNKGWSLTGDDNNLITLVSPSVAYVKGYRVETPDDVAIQLPKARDTKSVDGFIKNFGERTYILAKPTTNEYFIGPTGQIASHLNSNRVFLYDDVADGSSNNGTQIGSFAVSDVELHSGTFDSPDAVFKYFIYDVQMNSGRQFSEAKSMYSETPYAGSDVRANLFVPAGATVPVIHNTNRSALIYRLDRNNVASLRSSADPDSGSIDIDVRKSMSGTGTGGGFTFTLPEGEFFTGSVANLMITCYKGTTVRPVIGTDIMVTMGPDALTITSGAYDVNGATIHVVCSVKKTAQKERTKTISTNNFVFSGAALDQQYLSLSNTDVFDLSTAVIKSNGADTNLNFSDYYVLDPNITDHYYGISRLKRIKPLPAITTPSIEGTYRYFQHSGTAGYFTIDSYKSALADPDSGVTYESLPVYKDSAGNLYPVASSIDFRPDLNAAGEFIAPVFPASNSTMVFDVEYYIARADLLQINSDGALYIKRGEPSESPRPPRPDQDSMAIYEIWLKPYTYSLNDVSSTFIENRRYTMRDIGNLDKRLQNVEYYTVLNLLEKSAADMSIKDDNGFDRFKNGFIADNFQDFQAGDLASNEWRAAVDRVHRELRPRFKSRNRTLLFDAINSSGFVRRGNVALLPYVEEMMMEQPYATKHISVNPYLQYNKEGTLVLSPNNDVWSDETRLPDLVFDIDTGVDAIREIADAAGMLGTDWGSWTGQNATTIVPVQSTDMTSTEGWTNTGTTTNVIVVTNPDGTTTTTTTTSTDQIRYGETTTLDARVDEYTIDDIVKDVRIIPYIRETVVQFAATKMRANTRVYAFFDGVNVSEHVRDAGISITEDNVDTARDLIEYGSPLYTDANGEVRGEFRIPGGKFFVGEKVFTLTDDPGNTGDPDLVTTSAKSVFFAGGLDITRQNVTMNVITPGITREQLAEVRTLESTSVVTTTPAPVVPLPSPRDCSGDPASIPWQVYNWCRCNVWNFCGDPVAQAFTNDGDGFVSSLDIFFKQVDMRSDRIFVEIRNIVNGYPGPVVMARREFDPSEIEPFVSDDSTVPFRVEFDVPVYLEGGQMYCFVVGGFSPDTRVWVARTGGEVVNVPGKIVEMPAHPDPSFRSLNGSTWNAEQFEQIKYRLHRAVFTENEMTLRLYNSDVQDVVLGNDPLQFEGNNLNVRIHHKDHGFTTSDKINLRVYDKTPFVVTAATTQDVPQVGHILTTPSGASARVYDVVIGAAPNEYILKTVDAKGSFNTAEPVNAASKEIPFRDSFLVDQIGSQKAKARTINAFNGTVQTGLKSNKYPTGMINGVDADIFNGEFQIIEVDSPDSYVITLPGSATPEASGRFGGDGIIVSSANEKYELFNVSGAYLPYQCTESWKIAGIGHGDVGTQFEGHNYARMPAVAFSPGENRYLGQPWKMASALNETMVGDGGKSVHVTASFRSPSQYISPVINLDTFSVTTVSNSVGSVTYENEVNPNDIEGSETQVNIDHFDPFDGENLVWKSERNPAGGTEPFAYVTRTVNLAISAQELMILVDVYKDINADFDVYVKFQREYDSGTIDDKPWVLFDNVTKNRSSVDLSDFIEYSLKASESISDWDPDADPFISFKVKLVGRTTNSAKPPMFSALRCIALT